MPEIPDDLRALHSELNWRYIRAINTRSCNWDEIAEIREAQANLYSKAATALVCDGLLHFALGELSRVRYQQALAAKSRHELAEGQVA